MQTGTSQREIKALLSLADDPSPEVFREVSLKFRQLSGMAVPFLEEALMEQSSGLLRDRLERILRDIRYDMLAANLGQWVQHGGQGLLEAWLLLTQYHQPLADAQFARDAINRIRRDVWLELNQNLTALEQIKVFNHVFYGQHGFQGNIEDYHDPGNSLLNRVLETRKGNPLSIGIIYMLVARSLELPVAGINLPEHFVLAYMGRASDPGSSRAEGEVALFYINAFSGGGVFSTREINVFLAKLKLEPLPDYFVPCTNTDIIMRMLANLAVAYQRGGDRLKSKEMDDLRILLDKGRVAP